MEPRFEKSLKHRLEFVIGHAFRRFGVNIVAVGIEPGRAIDLDGAQMPGLLEDLTHRGVRALEVSVPKSGVPVHSGTGGVHLHGRDLEGLCRVIDDESWNVRFGRFEFKAELLLDGAEDIGRAIEIGRVVDLRILQSPGVWSFEAARPRAKSSS